MIEIEVYEFKYKIGTILYEKVKRSWWYLYDKYESKEKKVEIWKKI